ncbi:hypothetical protein CEUSTIGMA_g7905.t1 [Chlamydomonas eustigma]|uniref:Uncharacterized protein n=1 Tax=Chlamydomonas eustigma TaxID=1157962 RepID=A0A250XBM9_9CHLO|nr:hypothetical protein CEUSTIGMA_g7905.t1 [Chlamydomonas eustigma]|eukprot:GAX80466.1 hypothetical protein CEUSTIGMA_g7905.t1 [Chlamydomonas eustigma]
MSCEKAPSLYLSPVNLLNECISSTIDCPGVQLKLYHASLSNLWRGLSDMLQADCSNRSEVRSWLLSTIGTMPQMPYEIKSFLILPYLEWKQSTEQRPDQHLLIRRSLVELLCEQHRTKVANIVSDCPCLLRRFFSCHVSRIRAWFCHTSMAGIQHFQFGARALGLFALASRDEVWQHLVWTGKHSQAPVTVAAKTHYFCELDMEETVQNLVDKCPGFWTSEPWRACLESGDFLDLDPSWFHQELFSMCWGNMQDEGCLMKEQRHGGRCVDDHDWDKKREGNEDEDSSLEAERAGWHLHRLMVDSWLREDKVHATVDRPAFVTASSCWAMLCRRMLHLLSDQRLLELVQNITDHYNYTALERCKGDSKHRKSSTSDTRGEEERGKTMQKAKLEDMSNALGHGWIDLSGLLFDCSARGHNNTQGAGRIDALSNKGCRHDGEDRGTQGAGRIDAPSNKGCRHDGEDRGTPDNKGHDEGPGSLEIAKDSRHYKGSSSSSSKHKAQQEDRDLDSYYIRKDRSRRRLPQTSVREKDDSITALAYSYRTRDDPVGGGGGCVEWESLDQVILLHALCNCRTQLWHMAEQWAAKQRWTSNADSEDQGANASEENDATDGELPSNCPNDLRYRGKVERAQAGSNRETRKKEVCRCPRSPGGLVSKEANNKSSSLGDDVDILKQCLLLHASGNYGEQIHRITIQRACNTAKLHSTDRGSNKRISMLQSQNNRRVEGTISVSRHNNPSSSLLDVGSSSLNNASAAAEVDWMGLDAPMLSHNKMHASGSTAAAWARCLIALEAWSLRGALIQMSNDSLVQCAHQVPGLVCKASSSGMQVTTRSESKVIASTKILDKGNSANSVEGPYNYELIESTDDEEERRRRKRDNRETKHVKKRKRKRSRRKKGSSRRDRSPDNGSASSDSTESDTYSGGRSSIWAALADAPRGRAQIDGSHSSCTIDIEYAGSYRLSIHEASDFIACVACKHWMTC